MALRLVSGERLFRAFVRAGWSRDRQTGSHLILVKADLFAALSVPLRRELASRTMRALILASCLSGEQLQDLL